MASTAFRVFALIQNDLVHEIIRTEAAIGDLFHHGLTLVETTTDVAVGWRWTGGAFTPPSATPPSLAPPSPIDLLRAELTALRLRVDALSA